MDAKLTTLKAECRGDSVEFPPFLANHLPMILVALHRLGASEHRLAEFARRYRLSNGLPPPPMPHEPLDTGSWRSALGQREREGDLRAFFARDVAINGRRAALRSYLPELAPGVAGSAFHPLMRLAYAVMDDDDAELGIALGYWATTYLPLDRARGAAGITADPVQFLLRVARLEGLTDAAPESDLLWQHMRAVARMPAFAGVADWLVIGPETIDRMADAALALFAGTMSFEALHALTGCHWMRCLRPVMPDIDALLRHFWVGIAALLPKMGFPGLPDEEELATLRRRSAPPWAAVKAAAVASDDEHDISLAFSAFAEWQRTGDALYQVVAARRLGLIA